MNGREIHGEITSIPLIADHYNHWSIYHRRNVFEDQIRTRIAKTCRIVESIFDTSEYKIEQNEPNDP